jgi:mRNA interferase RelE/StbE
LEYKVEFTSAARRNINQLPESVAAAFFEFAYGPLSFNPQRVGKPLVGSFRGAFVARRGEYRVLYKVNQHKQSVEIFRIQHRRDAYLRR